MLVHSKEKVKFNNVSKKPGHNLDPKSNKK